MGYVDTVLQPGETVRFRTNRHWVGYVPGLALLLAGAACWVMGLEFEDWVGVWNMAALFLATAALVLLVRAWYVRVVTEIAVTNRRIIYKSGLLRRSISEWPLARIDSIHIPDQSILGQMLDYGDIRISGSNSGFDQKREDADRRDPNLLHRVASPLAFSSSAMAVEAPVSPIAPLRPVVEEIAAPAAAVAPEVVIIEPRSATPVVAEPPPPEPAAAAPVSEVREDAVVSSPAGRP